MARKLTPIPPGEILAEEYLAPLGISQNQLARDIDVPVSRVSGILGGTRAITADTALRFGKYFGTSPDLWLNLQAQYDLQVAKANTWPDIEARIRPHGWVLEERTDTIGGFRTMAETELRHPNFDRQYVSSLFAADHAMLGRFGEGKGLR